MSEHHQVIPRSLCFIENNWSLLLIEYSDKKWVMQWLYNCPGWHIELSEWIIENAEKEILEETGLEVENTRLRWVIHIEGFFGKNIILFVTMSTAKTRETVASDEWILHWITKDSISTVPLIEDVKLILEKLESIEETDIFTAKSVFDGGGKLLKLDFE